MCGIPLIFTQQEIGYTLKLGGLNFYQDGIGRQNIDFDQFRCSIGEMWSIECNLEKSRDEGVQKFWVEGVLWDSAVG